jgi:hypothetical protein
VRDGQGRKSTNDTGGNDEGDFQYTLLVLREKFIEANRCITLQEPLFYSRNLKIISPHTTNKDKLCGPLR